MNRTASLIAALGGCVVACAAHPPHSRDLSGQYQTFGAQGKSKLSLEIRQQQETAAIVFSAGNASGGGTAPEGCGKGRIAPDGSLHFQFEDSFGNRGTGVLQAASAHYQLTLNATAVADSRALTHYGSRTLLKQPSASSTDH